MRRCPLWYYKVPGGFFPVPYFFYEKACYNHTKKV